MGTWYAGDLLDVSDWPTNRTATLAGMAMFDVFARIEDSGVTNKLSLDRRIWRATGSVDFAANGGYVVSIRCRQILVQKIVLQVIVDLLLIMEYE